jgi:hypothetical protein
MRRNATEVVSTVREIRRTCRLGADSPASRRGGDALQEVRCGVADCESLCSRTDDQILDRPSGSKRRMSSVNHFWFF